MYLSKHGEIQSYESCGIELITKRLLDVRIMDALVSVDEIINYSHAYLSEVQLENSSGDIF